MDRPLPHVPAPALSGQGVPGAEGPGLAARGNEAQVKEQIMAASAHVKVSLFMVILLRQGSQISFLRAGAVHSLTSPSAL